MGGKEKMHPLSLRSCAATLALLGSLIAGAQAETLATFADPSDGSVPLFEFASDGTSGTLAGGWDLNGLLLLTPGLDGDPNYPDARFSMAPVAATRISNTLWSIGEGSIDFRDNGGALLFTISFESATLVTPQGFGGSDFAANDVTFSGPIVPPGLHDEAFAFSFANPRGDFENYTVTASFTSSGVPEPASVVLVALGGLAALIRRR
jgi:hypothetical protein